MPESEREKIVESSSATEADSGSSFTEELDALAAELDGVSPDKEAFDFESHRRHAVDEYQAQWNTYEDCALAVRSVLQTILIEQEKNLLIQSLEARAKSIESFGDKAALPSTNDPNRPKYPKPLSEITDLAGARVITFLLDTVDQVNEIIETEFEIVEKSTKSGLMEEGEKLGYQSVHFLVKFSQARCGLPEYARFKDLITEIQVRTILQHAWAEIEHDIQYKAVETIPDSIRRRFTSLAGLVEIADREFQAISAEDQKNRSDALRLIQDGDLDRVEITPTSMKAYLDNKLGPDGRQSDWSYGWIAKLVKRMGIENLAELDEIVKPYDADRISRTLWGTRQGQIRRLEDVLLAATGQKFAYALPWIASDPQGGHARYVRALMERLENRGIDVGGDYSDLPGPPASR